MHERGLLEWESRERVCRVGKKYVIPHHEEFNIKALLKLQAEYDSIEPDGSNVLRRQTLLDMIRDLHRNIIVRLDRYQISR